ncbi:MAG: bifunctional heptose 7-phosphate kinase/heptose 1-phosphate adenyltransferase [Deltaproteobacteria bacterium]|nr:MAG: bifunctional heptose 7-phosphate kinase/heptose 1-phosphate adenyltransferase [Deltaproteobacteria bacterium]PIE75036.1 MAG: bifunctional heptose 7-phosphate kinase/heptose 1-phosphate adenyltransferase [Deltaproteobacteria bacterium]
MVENLGKGKITVAGDVMLDSYWHGLTSRISPEAPVPVVKVTDYDSRPGGSANVAINIGSLGAKCDMIAVTGDDTACMEIEKSFERFDIKAKFQKIKNAKTISKLRIISQNQQLIRIDHEEGFPDIKRDEIEKFFEDSIIDSNVVVISDYAKGTLKSAKEWIKKAVLLGKPVIVDPKGADFSKYKNATIITPNFKEFEAVVGKCRTEKEIIKKGTALIKELNLNTLLVTRGKKGMTLIFDENEFINVPSETKEVFDVTGAGDTVVAALAAALSSGLDLLSAVKIANYAAGIVVSKLGTAFTTKTEIKNTLLLKGKKKFKPLKKGIVSCENLFELLSEAKKYGEKIVMTNGCFDILHPGHVSYLKKAKELGDRLIVAVNSDNSVKKLKGESRPLNPCSTRMTMLDALESTDWIVEFEEETPKKLIEKILPDILVKGGDYKVDEIAGAEAVLKNGGDVKIIEFLDGYSTTSLIRKIKE